MKRVGILIEDSNNKEFISKSLSGRFNLLIDKDLKSIYNNTDLLIVSLNYFKSEKKEIAAYKSDSQTSFIQILVICTKDDVNGITDDSWEIFDDLLILPFYKGELIKRVELLLRLSACLKKLSEDLGVQYQDPSLWGKNIKPKDIESSLDKDKGMLNALFESLPDIIIFKSKDGNYLGCNSKFTEFVDRPKYQIIGKTDYDLFEKELADYFTNQDNQALRQLGPCYIEKEITYPPPDKIKKVIHILKTPYRGPQNEIIGILGVGRDITVEKMLEKKLTKNIERNKILFEASADAITYLKNGRFIDCNFATLEILGVNDKKDILDKMPSELSPQKQPDGRLSSEKEKDIINLAVEKGTYRFEWAFNKQNGGIVYTEVQLTALKEDDGTYIFNSSWRDITEKKEQENHLKYDSLHDYLTALPNKRFFINVYKNSILNYNRYKNKFALISIDLDDFKSINDSNGHRSGDEALKIIARRLKEEMREIDFVARMGGDEFAVILQRCLSIEDALRAANRLNQRIKAPLEIDGISYQIGASIGLGIYPDNAEDENEFLSLVDNYMYEAKRFGGYTIFYAEKKIF